MFDYGRSQMCTILRARNESEYGSSRFNCDLNPFSQTGLVLSRGFMSVAQRHPVGAMGTAAII